MTSMQENQRVEETCGCGAKIVATGYCADQIVEKFRRDHAECRASEGGNDHGE